MTNIADTDDKLMVYMGRSMMIVVGAIMMSYLLQQIFPQQQVQPETYGMWYFGPAGHIMNVENGVDEEPSYTGEAMPGTLNSEPGWRIYKYAYVRDPVSGDMLSGTLRYADNSTNFDKIWDNRADYVYL